ncbi:MAG: FtsX-like permease family protein, partial [Gemmatimonadaceae bacterium]
DYNQWGTRPRTGPMVAAENIKMNTPQQRFISGDYFRAVGIRLIQGRIFDAGDDNKAPKRALISQEIADKYFPGVSAIGQRIETGDGEHEVIGVVNDVSSNAEGNLAPTVYHAHAQAAGDRNWLLSQVVLTSSEPTTLINPVRKTISELDPALVMFQPQTLASTIGQGIATRVFTLRLLTAFATVALLLASLGLYGVLSYAVKLRTREFGIRMALGADRSSIRNTVMKRGLTVAAIGIVIGLGGAFALSRVMASMVFQTSPLDPMVIGGAVLFMGLVAMVAAYIPAYRATGVDPKEALASE